MDGASMTSPLQRINPPETSESQRARTLDAREKASNNGQGLFKWLRLPGWSNGHQLALSPGLRHRKVSQTMDVWSR